MPSPAQGAGGRGSERPASLYPHLIVRHVGISHRLVWWSPTAIVQGLYVRARNHAVGISAGVVDLWVARAWPRGICRRCPRPLLAVDRLTLHQALHRGTAAPSHRALVP